MNEYFKDINWEELLKDKSVDEMWEIIKVKIETAQKCMSQIKLLQTIE